MNKFPENEINIPVRRIRDLQIYTLWESGPTLRFILRLPSEPVAGYPEWK